MTKIEKLSKYHEALKALLTLMAEDIGLGGDYGEDLSEYLNDRLVEALNDYGIDPFLETEV